MKAFLERQVIREKAGWQGYLAAAGLALTAISIVYGLEHLTVEKFSNISGFLILAVLVSAILFGRGPSLLTALMCSLLYDWLMVPPFFEGGGSADNLIKFGVFIAAALLAGWVAGMSRNLAIRLKRREQELMKVIAQREDLRREKEEEMIRREAEGLRNAILTSVSHDLKTPLASIIGAVSSLKRHGHSLSEEDKTHLQTSVLGEANKLSGYVSNLLEMAKLEHGTAALRHETVAVDDLFDLTTKRMAGRLRTHAVEILPEEVPLSVQGDERLLDVALGNLLDNAVKFSPAGARIVLSAQTDEHGQVMVMVEDEGCGLPDDVPPGQALSDAFFRARREDRSNHGTGLGLWIAQRIAQAHGGSIDLRQGKTGVCAVLRLPLAVMPSLPQEEEEHA